MNIALLPTAAMAEALIGAYSCGPILTLGGDGVALDGITAHAVRDATIQHWRDAGRRTVGRKIGLTSVAIRARLGASEPTDGYLFADTAVPNGGLVDCRKLYQPLAELEIALIVGRDILALPDDPAELRSTIAAAATAIEIVDSRIAAWRITYADAIADNGSASGFVLSDELRNFNDAQEFAWEMKCDGTDMHRSSGTSAASVILRDFRWLAGKAIAIGAPLRAGEIVLSGALGGAIPVGAGDMLSVAIAGLGACQVSFR